MWLTLLVMFSFVAQLIFPEVDELHDFEKTFYYFASSALGGFDFSIFTVRNHDGMVDEVPTALGRAYLLLFLLLNMVLIANFLIAILSQTYKDN